MSDATDQEVRGGSEGEADVQARRGNAPLAHHDAVGFALPADWITLGPPCPRPDPRPGPRASSAQGLGGRLKERAGDFLVEEIPAYDPCGEGEHLYLGVQKTNMPHTEMLGVLCRHFRVEESAIGFAGMKDRVAVTQQTVSVHLPVERAVGELRHERLQVLWAMRHANKLRRGHLRGNRFAIRIRGVDPLKVVEVKRRMEMLAREGIPDYFGEQRFGYRANNQVYGRLYARGAWQPLLDELLGPHGTPFPPHQRAVREAYAEGRFAEAHEMWGRHDQAERIALRALAKGRDAAGAVRAIPNHIRDFWMSALQAAVYNQALARRVADGSFARVLRGDVVSLAGKGSVFAVAEDAPDAELAELDARCAALDLSPAGPIFGPSMVEASGVPAAHERAALAAHGCDGGEFAPPVLSQEGARRPFRIAMRDWAVDAGVDEHGGYIRLVFDLPKGAFATVLCREIMG
ncbi:MAG: tRNA pseudouridine(13) synthase TruD [Planctomycetota bacterium]